MIIMTIINTINTINTIIIIIPGIVADKATPAFVPMWKLEE